MLFLIQIEAYKNIEISMLIFEFLMLFISFSPSF